MLVVSDGCNAGRGGTSMTLSVMSARRCRSIDASAEARTILTLGGSRCRKSSRRNVLASADVPSLSPSSCCMWRRSCVGLRSPSSSPLMSCCSFRCSEAAVRLVSSALSVSYVLSSGGRSRRSRTSTANSVEREAMT